MLPRRRSLLFVGLLAGIALPGFAADTAPAKAPADPNADVYEAGRELFERYATPEIKAQFEFPSKTQWDAFTQRLQRALEGNSLQELGAYESEARAALAALRSLPDETPYADWLAERLDYISASNVLPVPKTFPAPPGSRPAAPAGIPNYDFWVARVASRPAPARATELMPQLRAAFAAEGVPSELAWLAEAESSFNPEARSPVGASGLFQLMPTTAQSLGLNTASPDDRDDPVKSAHAAARYLRQLHGRFGTWTLALAAYNAGEGRVNRALTAQGAKDFSGIASVLPSETRMYVPKVCALVALRTGVAPDDLPPPRTGGG
jgi:membrane-bound lytic murein transglycosylase D